MAQFTLYPIRAQGVSATFQVIDCKDVVEAYERAEEMLTTHLTAMTVEVWETDKLVLTVKRQSQIATR
jgi:hypothetical protein